MSSRLFLRNLEIKIYKIIILSVVLYGCETLSPILREEHTFSDFENGVLRKISRPEREEVRTGSRRLYSVELHNLYASPHIIRVIKSRRMRWEGYIARMRDMVSVGKSEVKRPFGGPRLGWEDNIRMDIEEMSLEVVDWLYLAQD